MCVKYLYTHTGYLVVLEIVNTLYGTNVVTVKPTCKLFVPLTVILERVQINANRLSYTRNPASTNATPKKGMKSPVQDSRFPLNGGS
jgi:hypothetical protein